MSASREVLQAPSQHPIPDDLPNAASWRLRVDGLVEQPLALSLEDLAALPVRAHQGSYTCERGWEAGRAVWSGPTLAQVLALARPLGDASALYAYAPSYRALVPLDASDGAVLALAVDGAPLNEARGAPCRLVVTDPDCQLSMKWLERLELIRRPPDELPGPRKPAAAT